MGTYRNGGWESDDYIPDESGWRLNPDTGDAEFNGSFNGTITNPGF